MDQKIDYQKLIDWCDEKVATGSELSITWDGGGDSGWFEIKLDGENIYSEGYDPKSLKIEDQLLKIAAQHADYGSFAGEFHTQGKLVYSTKLEGFIGTDNYSESVEDEGNPQVKIIIPEHLWFDRVSFSTEGSEDIEDLQFVIEVINGPVIDEHSTLSIITGNQLRKNLNEWLSNINEIITGCYSEKTIPKSEFILTDQGWEHTITNFGYAIESSEYKHVWIPIDPKNEQEPTDEEYN